MTVQSDARWRRVLEGTLGIPATEGNQVEVLRDGATIFPAMLEAIGAASRTVDLLTFVYWRGDIARRFADTLCDRARAGVRCRVILDALGARHVDQELIDRMIDAGVHLHWFRPITEPDALTTPGHRTHRKVVVCDEEVGFTGGIGIAEEWDGSSDDGSGWRETQLRLRGPVVDGLRAAFLDDWLDAGEELFDDRDRFPEQPAAGATTAMVVRGESEHGQSDIAMLRRVLFERARRRLRITTPYFAPDEGIFAALAAAVARGVQVQLLLPGPNNDKEVARLAAERRYPDALDAGIELHHYRPTMLHAKVLTVDGEVAVVGSANLNHRSLQLDEEVDVVLLDPEVTARLDADTDRDLERSVRVTSDALHEGAHAARSPLRTLTGLVDRWT
jgi:cardiolipin synthase A/B